MPTQINSQLELKWIRNFLESEMQSETEIAKPANNYHLLFKLHDEMFMGLDSRKFCDMFAAWKFGKDFQLKEF